MTVKLQRPRPLQAPDQPSSADPLAGLTVTDTAVPVTNVMAQDALQVVMPRAVLKLTVPPPSRSAV